jgi:hypothetical protein
VFEDDSFADKAAMAVEKEIHQGGDGMGEHVEVVEKRPVAGEEIMEKRSV